MRKMWEHVGKGKQRAPRVRRRTPYRSAGHIIRGRAKGGGVEGEEGEGGTVVYRRGVRADGGRERKVCEN